MGCYAGILMKRPGVEHAERNEDGTFLPVHKDKIRVQRFKDYILATRSHYTCLSYATSVRRFEKFLEEKEIVLKDAGPGLLQDFIVWLSEQDLSPASIHLIYEGVKAYTNWCRDHGEVICQSFSRPKMPKGEIREPFILQPKELNLYFKGVIKLKEPTRTALLILPYCGLRVSELCKLKLTDVGYEYDEAGVKWIVFDVKGKGDKIRRCPICLEANSIFKKYLEGWRTKVQRTGKPIWLFPSRYGKSKYVHLSPRTLQLTLRNIRDDMNLPKQLTPHALRRTCFTYLYRRGVDITTIARIAGHSSVDTTIKHYIHISTRDILNKMR